MRRALIALATVPVAAWCQVPVVSQVVNAASYQTTSGSPGPSKAIASRPAGRSSSQTWSTRTR